MEKLVKDFEKLFSVLWWGNKNSKLSSGHWEISGQWNTEDKNKCIVTTQFVVSGEGKAENTGGVWAGSGTDLTFLVPQPSGFPDNRHPSLGQQEMTT